jgi:hypothetical protein
MFDNSMTGAVGFAMHADRLAQATRNLRLAQAQHGRRAAKRHPMRAACVHRLIGLARIAAPPVAVHNPARPTSMP